MMLPEINPDRLEHLKIFWFEAGSKIISPGRTGPGSKKNSRVISRARPGTKKISRVGLGLNNFFLPTGAGDQLC
jgi:hypothetical protein